jgi:hypothetical protein
VTFKDFENNSGAGLIETQFGKSPSRAVISVYHDQEFLPWLFKITPKGYFEKSENIRKYVEWLRRKTGRDDWRDLETKDFVENHGSRLLKIYNGSVEAILDSLKDKGDLQESKTSSDRPIKPSKYWVQTILHFVDFSSHLITSVRIRYHSKRLFWTLLGSKLESEVVIYRLGIKSLRGP